MSVSFVRNIEFNVVIIFRPADSFRLRLFCHCLIEPICVFGFYLVAFYFARLHFYYF